MRSGISPFSQICTLCRRLWKGKIVKAPGFNLHLTGPGGSFEIPWQEVSSEAWGLLWTEIQILYQTDRLQDLPVSNCSESKAVTPPRKSSTQFCFLHWQESFQGISRCVWALNFDGRIQDEQILREYVISGQTSSDRHADRHDQCFHNKLIQACCMGITIIIRADWFHCIPHQIEIVTECWRSIFMLAWSGWMHLRYGRASHGKAPLG
jgi:hypothetical protein